MGKRRLTLIILSRFVISYRFQIQYNENININFLKDQRFNYDKGVTPFFKIILPYLTVSPVTTMA